MRRATLATCIALLMTVGLACSSGDRVEDSAGGVILRVSDTDGLVLNPSVNTLANNTSPLFVIDTIELENIPKNQDAVTSPLMDVEMRSYEVVYTRTDTGTVAPPPLVRSIRGLVPVNGTLTYDTFVLMAASQLLNPPLSDLLLENGGIDRETGSNVITLELRLRFFGRTIAGDDVATAPIAFEVQFGL